MGFSLAHESHVTSDIIMIIFTLRWLHWLNADELDAFNAIKLPENINIQTVWVLTFKIMQYKIWKFIDGLTFGLFVWQQFDVSSRVLIQLEMVRYLNTAR